MSQKRQWSCRDGKDSLLGDRLGTDSDERPDGRLDEERRVVVAVAAAGAIDEHGVLAAELRPPPPLLELARQRTQAPAPLLLHARRDDVGARGARSRPG